MQVPENVLEIFLQPGEFFFGDHETRIRTILGSCVSMTFWHPQKKIGGMTHMMLPSRPKNVFENTHTEVVLNAKYGDESLMLMMREMKAHKTTPAEYQVKLFGGGNMFHQTVQDLKTLIGTKNSEMAKQLLCEYGFKIQAKHVGGAGHRSIIFDVWSGHVWVKHSPLTHAAPV